MSRILLNFHYICHKMVLAAIVSTPSPQTEGRRTKDRGAETTKQVLPFSSGNPKYFKSHEGGSDSRNQDCWEQLRPVLIYHLRLGMPSAKNKVVIKLQGEGKPGDLSVESLSCCLAAF